VNRQQGGAPMGEQLKDQKGVTWIELMIVVAIIRDFGGDRHPKLLGVSGPVPPVGSPDQPGRDLCIGSRLLRCKQSVLRFCDDWLLHGCPLEPVYLPGSDRRWHWREHWSAGRRHVLYRCRISNGRWNMHSGSRRYCGVRRHIAWGRCGRGLHGDRFREY